MRKLTIAATTIAVGSLFGVLAAQAEDIRGAPMKNGNQCFNYASGNARDARFGSWSACPQAASVAGQNGQNGQNGQRRVARRTTR
jgi:hypothetical protein